MNTQNAQAPVKEFRVGAIKASIWRNEVQDSESGRTTVQHSVRVQKRYRDTKSGEWKDTNYYFQNDLSKLILVVQKAYEFVSLVESDDADFPPADQ